MPICNGCGEFTSRVRLTFRGLESKEECPKCAPQSFEKFKSVRDGTIAMAYEYDHKRYHFEDGVPNLTDEGRQDLHDEVSKESEDVKVGEAAIERKRRERRTSPLSQAEIEQGVNMAKELLEAQ